MSEKEIELFVPGRLCLFGEHSDWAGGHRRQNPEIGKGYTIVAPTNQGNYAIARRIAEPLFKFISKPLGESLSVDLEREKLLKIAEEGGTFSYVAGVAQEIISSYNQVDGGIEIENDKTDLPIKRGLSSSASICVLTAKAFNELYNLGFTNKRIMELAYLGETSTPSRCGKMDQACAYGKPVLMTFDGDKINIEELKIGGDFYLLILDLKSKKDTIRILADLSKGFPFPTTEEEQKKQRYFNRVNPLKIEIAKSALEKGNADFLGATMSAAQKDFDEYLLPSCPSELRAPKLHQVLNLRKIQDYIYGGKGIGSGGDGSAQLVCKSKEDREKVRRILEEELKLECFDLDLKKT